MKTMRNTGRRLLPKASQHLGVGLDSVDRRDRETRGDSRARETGPGGERENARTGRRRVEHYTELSLLHVLGY